MLETCDPSKRYNGLWNINDLHLQRAKINPVDPFILPDWSQDEDWVKIWIQPAHLYEIQILVAVEMIVIFYAYVKLLVY